MRILFVAPYVPSPIRVRPYNLLHQISAHHKVTLVATTTSDQDASDVGRLSSVCEAVHLVHLSRGGSLMGCGRAALRGEPLQSGFCRSNPLEHTVRSMLTERSFDLVHVEHLRAGWVGDLIPAEMPAVFDSVDSISLLLERTLRHSHSLAQRLIAAIELGRSRKYEARLMTRFKAVAVTSAEDAGALKSLAPTASITVIPNGVDLDYFRPMDMNREPATLVFSGKMSYHANVTALLHFVHKILPLIRERRPDVKLRVVGSNPPAVVRALANLPGIAVTGFLPDIRPELASATIAICPVTVKVGIQNKVLEAMAMGLPVVSTEAGALGLQIEPGVDALVAGSPSEFAAHVCQLLSDQPLRQSLAASGRQYVERFHRWESAAQQLQILYAQVSALASRAAVA